MDEYQKPPDEGNEQNRRPRLTVVDPEPSEHEQIAQIDDLDVRRMFEEAHRRRESMASRRRWGRVLIVIGALTLIDSCAPIPIPLVGPPAIVIGAILMVAGFLLSNRGAKTRQTTEAIMVAAKYKNKLTVTRLAYEMDVSPERAQAIIDQLIKNGIAEVDLDAKSPEEGLVYRIKGI
jgi:hypothetical protein